MKLAAGLTGILLGIFSHVYVGLFGGLIGSAAGWLGSWGPQGNALSSWAEMATVLNWLSPLLAIGGGAIAFSNPRLGGALLAASALCHWYLLGFGSIGNVFIFPIAIASILAFVAGFSEMPRPPALAAAGARPAFTSPSLRTSLAGSSVAMSAASGTDSHTPNEVTPMSSSPPNTDPPQRPYRQEAPPNVPRSSPIAGLRSRWQCTTPSTRRLAAVVAGVFFLCVAGAAAWARSDTIRVWLEGVHGVDFRNAAIDVSDTSCANDKLQSAGATTVPLQDAAYRVETPFAYDFKLASDVKYGNVSGDLGKNQPEKAVFVGSCANGSAPTQVLFVYSTASGHPVRLAALNLGGGGLGGFHSLDVRDGVIKVEQLQGNAYCCATGLITNTYAWLGSRLVRTAQSSVIAMPQAVQTGQTPDASAPAASGEQEVSFQYFRDQLSPYGSWVHHPRWGDVWRPNAGSDFHPYQDGHWVNTNDCGMVWASDYSWGDIPFHYGRWGYDPNFGGWLWAPGYVWGPAWVVWRQGGGNVGWMPMPPGDGYDGVGSYRADLADWYGYRTLYGAALPPSAFYSMWVFVGQNRIFDPAIRTDVIERESYGGFIERTANITRYSLVGGRIANRSFDVGRFELATGRRVPVVAVNAVFHRGIPMTSMTEGRRIETHEVVHQGPLTTLSRRHTPVSFGSTGIRATAHFGHTASAVSSSATFHHGFERPVGGGRGALESGAAMHTSSQFGEHRFGVPGSSGVAFPSRVPQSGYSAQTPPYGHTFGNAYSRPSTLGAQSGQPNVYGHAGFSGMAQRPSFGNAVTSNTGASVAPATSMSAFRPAQQPVAQPQPVRTFAPPVQSTRKKCEKNQRC